MYIYIGAHINNKKVIHIKTPRISKEIKLYTALSTLSTIINYSCRMDKTMSISKIRFVTYYRMTRFYKEFLYLGSFFNCRIIGVSTTIFV